MKVQQLVSLSAWGALVLFMVPALSSKASAHTSPDEAIPLESSVCWARCSICTRRCASMPGADRIHCERACQAGNDQCCEGSGRHGASRTCGCY
jgi:hypothetical protein